MEPEQRCLSLQSGRGTYLASVTTTGLAVYKVRRERGAVVSHGPHTYYVRGGQLRHLGPRGEEVLATLQGMKEARVVGLAYNAMEHAVLVSSCLKDVHHSYQLFFLLEGCKTIKPKIKASPGQFAVWLSHNRFALLDKTGKLIIKNLENQNINFGGMARGFLLPKADAQRLTFKVPACSRLHAGGRPGCLLLQDGDTLVHYDTERKRRLCSGSFPGLHRAIWGQGVVALLARNMLWLADGKLNILSTFTFRTPVKSGAWCPLTSAFLLTTELQLRYCLPSGEEGALLSLPRPLYLASVASEEGRAVCLDREGVAHVLAINTAEYRFKSAVLAGRDSEVTSLVTGGKLLGQGLLQFLRRAGRPELALGFIQDPLSRFCLALEATDLASALTAASSLDRADCWAKLASLALLLGDPAVAETSLMKARNHHGLLLLYLTTGQTCKLGKLARILEAKGDASAAFQCCLATGRVEARAGLLARAGQPGLASLTRLVHGLEEGLAPGGGVVLAPPPPILALTSAWPRRRGPQVGEVARETLRDQRVASSGCDTHL